MGHVDPSPHAPWLLALGAEPPPREFVVGARRFIHERTFKHDFFAFTACYRAAEDDPSGEERIVIKIARRSSLWGFPLGWFGRLMTLHEGALYQRAQDLEIVPAFLGRIAPDVLSHVYQPGTDLHRSSAVPDDFFDQLRRGVDAMHAREIAVVDLEKPENVLVGDDGRPYLFDFQISFFWPERWGGRLWPVSWIRRLMQQVDRYHVQKLKRRFRIDLMSPAEIEAARRRPLPIRLHRKLAAPFQLVRRRILRRSEPSLRREEAGRVLSARDAEA